MARKIRQAELYIPLFDQTCLVDSWWMYCYGQYEALDPADVYLDPLLALDYPLIFDPDQLSKDRKRLIRMAIPAAGDKPPPRYPTPLLGTSTTLGLRPPTRHLDPLLEIPTTLPDRTENQPTRIENPT